MTPNVPTEALPVPEDIMARMPDKVKEHFKALNAKAKASKARKRQADAEALAYVKPLAQVWLDAYLTMEHQTDATIDALGATHGGLQDLLQFGPLLVKHLHSRSRGERHYVIRTESSGRGRHHIRNAQGEYLRTVRGPAYNDPKFVHCRYCGVKLKRASATVGGDYDSHPNVYLHVTQCALESLAGLRIPVAPGGTVITEDSEGQTP